jgi:uncharacterized protein (DUF1778 family)
MSHASSGKDARLVARVSQDVQEFVKNAADLSGATLSQFIVEAVTAKARTVINEERLIKLTLEEAEVVFNALENPPPTNSKLLDAAKRMKQQGGFQYVRNSST